MEDLQFLTTSSRQSPMPWAFSRSPEVLNNWSVPTSSDPVPAMHSLYPSFSRPDTSFLGQQNSPSSSIAYANQDNLPYPDLALQSPDIYSSPSPEQLSDVPNSIPNEIGRRKGMYKLPEIDASIRKEKKRIQNRIAQKSFRKRKQDYVEALEMRVRELEAELEAHRQGSYCFDGLVASLIQEDSIPCQS